MRNGEVTVQIQGVRVNFSSNFDPLISFARTHFGERQNGALDSPAPFPIEARLDWIEGAPRRKRHLELKPGRTRLDRDIEIGNGELAWSRIDDFLDLQLCFYPTENHLRLVGQHFFSLHRMPIRDYLQKSWHRKRLPRLRTQRFSTILYYLIYYPSFWRLERQGFMPLHAAAVDLGGTGVVFCGLPGSGKSTLSLAVLSLPHARLLSDNIIFHDNERVLSCPEPVLVDDRSIELIGKAGSALYPLGRQHVFERSWCHVGGNRLVEATAPRIFFFVGLGAATTVRPLSIEQAHQRFASANWIAKELRRYLVYRSVLDLSSPGGVSLNNGKQSTLPELLSRGQSYELIVGWGDGMAKAVDLVSKLAASFTG